MTPPYNLPLLGRFDNVEIWTGHSCDSFTPAASRNLGPQFESFFGSIPDPLPSNPPDRAMKTNELLANLRVASPCPARWADMLGDDRARFCAQCEKHVYNLSELSAVQATTLIQEKEGQLCARFYQRADGTILTADCPVGAGRVHKRVKRLAGAAAALVAVSFAAPVAVTEASDAPEIRPKLFQAWDRAVVTAKTWLGLQPSAPPLMIMGEISIGPNNRTPKATQGRSTPVTQTQPPAPVP